MADIPQTCEPKGTRPDPIGPYLVCGVLMVGIFLADMAIPLGVAVGVCYIAAVWLALWSSRTRLILLVAVVCSLLTVAAFVLKPPAGELWKVLCNRFLAISAIWLTAFLGLQRKTLEENRQKAVRDREKALEEIKILRGFLRICASCKKIRDDEGNWTQLEAYIRDHSQAEFSHGLCPECVKKLYPDLPRRPSN
ncbi:MAG: hypothetical protein AB1646_14275 [Thermodesulfobacteriota bacterium]